MCEEPCLQTVEQQHHPPHIKSLKDSSALQELNIQDKVLPGKEEDIYVDDPQAQLLPLGQHRKDFSSRLKRSLHIWTGVAERCYPVLEQQDFCINDNRTSSQLTRPLTNWKYLSNIYLDGNRRFSKLSKRLPIFNLCCCLKWLNGLIFSQSEIFHSSNIWFFFSVSYCEYIMDRAQFL